MYLTDWRMNYEEHTGLACKAPCSMYGVLLDHGLIEDPFYGLNEQAATRLSDKDCVFETEFSVVLGIPTNQVQDYVKDKLSA